MLVRLNHRGVTDVTKPFRIQEGVAISRSLEAKGVVHVTPEQLNAHEQMMMQKMEEAETQAKDKSKLDFVKQ